LQRLNVNLVALFEVNTPSILAIKSAVEDLLGVLNLCAMIEREANRGF
jgi:hypothetical protein